MAMKRVCAWCGKAMGPNGARDSAADHPLTHGICGDCFRGALSSTATPLSTFLDRFQDPILVVNSEGTVLTGNAAALTRLNRQPDQVQARLAGNVLSCPHAQSGRSCGETLLCKTCTIRASVRCTLESGKACVAVPALPDLQCITGETQPRYLITTERVGDTVLLRIEDPPQDSARQ
jgi:hypothetical protein